MRDEIMLDILSAIARGTYTTRELIRVSGHSPNTVIRYLNGLQERGLIDRVNARKTGPGRPPTVLRATELGLSWMKSDQVSVLRKLHKEADALWGPKKSFSYWGVPLFGRADVFAKKKVDASPFELIVEKTGPLYEHPVENVEGFFPSRESLATWASTSDNPRFLGAGAVILKSPDLDVERLTKNATAMGACNRVGFLASLSGIDRVVNALPKPVKDERMLERRLPVDDQTEALARRWRVTNPVSASVVTDMVHLYGGTR